MKNIITFPSNLFRSKTRQKVLGLFFTNPKSRYYVRQLQSMFQVSVGSLHRELKHLEEIGILKSERQGNLKYYSINTDYPLFNELKGIVSKTIGVEGSLREIIKDIFGISIAFIYGSFASGKETERSDIDLFLIGEFDEDLLNKKLRSLEQYLAREITYTSMKKSEFKEEKQKKFKFLRTLLNEPKLFLIGDENELQRLS
ncbi:MAG: nucleotidyltransferase domain-containing protein [Candidatus Humimicrobiia bacterium]